MKKENKGITLVALVVTVIILLILAGISIASLTGNGLFEKAKLAKEKQENSQQLESVILNDYENSINSSIVSNRDYETEINKLKEEIAVLKQKNAITISNLFSGSVGKGSTNNILSEDFRNYKFLLIYAQWTYGEVGCQSLLINTDKIFVSESYKTDGTPYSSFNIIWDASYAITIYFNSYTEFSITDSSSYKDLIVTDIYGIK